MPSISIGRGARRHRLPSSYFLSRFVPRFPLLFLLVRFHDDTGGMKDESPKAKPRAKTTLRIAKTQTEAEDDLNIISLSYYVVRKI